MFNNIYLYSTFYIYIQRYAFSFNFNPNYFHSTKIFVQLQPKIISFNKNICSTSTKNNFIQQQYLFNFNHNYFYSTIKFPDIQNSHSTKFPVPPPELPRTLSQIPSVLGTQNTESVKNHRLGQVKSSIILLKNHLYSYEALSQ